MKRSRFTTDAEQKTQNENYSGVKFEQAPPRSEWMTVDECFDDIIDSVEEIYNNKEFNSPKWIPLDETEEELVDAVSKIYDEAHNQDEQ